MQVSGRHICGSWLFYAAILLPAGQTQDAREVFESLVQDAFAGEDLLLILDAGAEDELEVKTATDSSGSVLLLSSDNSSHFFQKTPSHLVRGSHFTALLVFTASVVPFMKTLDTKWNPDFMLLMSLNSSVNSTALLADEIFQRSQHLALVEPDNRTQRTRFMVFSSLPMKGRSAVKYSLGQWSRGRFRRKQDFFPERFHTLHGAVLQLGSWCDDFPFLYPEHGLCIGSSLDMLDLIAAHLNFSYDVQMEPEDHKWGSWEEGQWTGMLGDLAYNNKDLVINVFQMTQEIFADFEVSYPYHVESYVFLLAVPEPAPQWHGLLYPFTATVWLAVLGTITVVIVLLNLCLKAVPDTQDDSQVFLLVLGGILRQAVSHRLGQWWAREWAGWWWLTGVISFPRRIETVEQLATSNLRVAMQDYGSFVPDALRASPDPALYKLGANLDLFPYVYLNYEVGFSWVSNRTHGLVETRSYLAYVVSLHNVSGATYVMKETVYPGYLCWILRKNCPYADRVWQALEALVEAGLVQYKYRKHMLISSGSQDAHDRVLAGEALQLGQMLGAFMLAAMGLGLATLVFVGEKLSSLITNK
ncbi:hypothetical protein O3P69_001924 [Scylla paramamosain]|uniref:Ionotropic glutamate receptor L-glutamate and glycine-binding domain-containing protein n=1 Tax=Scylla paramamosain TaxID=85552 RepID=A0AAW0V1B2_SCYPA